MIVDDHIYLVCTSYKVRDPHVHAFNRLKMMQMNHAHQTGQSVLDALPIYEHCGSYAGYYKDKCTRLRP
jgi:hypothetical protein